MYGELLLGLAIILVGAEFFTNSIEWLGVKLGLSEGGVGSVLAAVGTALPESMIPIVAILFGSSEYASHIGIGAIIGAPFMLGTLAFFIAGCSTRFFVWRGSLTKNLHIDVEIVKRDLCFFFLCYTLALAISLADWFWLRGGVAFILVLIYAIYVYRTFKSGKQMGGHNLRPLYFCFWREASLKIIYFQIILALGAIIGGAHYFVSGIEELAKVLSIPPLILALIITPVATELPEKFNSIIWLGQKKDTLAIGNITGAMVFQSSILPALGIILTPWELDGISLLSGFLVLISTFMVTFSLIRSQALKSSVLIFCGFFYLIFLMVVYWTTI